MPDVVDGGLEDEHIAMPRRREEAPPHFDASLRLGRELGADYEVGRTLQAKVLTGFASDDELAEAEAIMARLGVVSLPAPPLP